ncbi:unnamed protein product [Danaus chrysippus]|uniref:Phosphodiesterase n=1 Tax=Danaus chrysippus TaxID=151541 RepID=A0A8J2MHI6_9NEOP|nr:unnamed protein product [Danaus chrysippus]
MHQPRSNIPRPSRHIIKTILSTENKEKKCADIFKNSGPEYSSKERRCIRNELKKSQILDEKSLSERTTPEGLDANVVDYLDHNKMFLESYIINSVSINQLEKWLAKKRHKYYESGNDFRHSDRLKEKISNKNVFLELFNSLKRDKNEHSIVIDIVRLITMTIEVDAYRVYKLFPDHDSFVQYFVADQSQLISTQLRRVDLNQIENVLRVAKDGTCLRLSRENTVNFPRICKNLLEAFGIRNLEEAKHVLYQPILTANSKTGYVIEMWRTKKEFDDRDEHLSSNYIVWGSLILQYCNLCLDKMRERNMTDFLLDVVKAIFEEMVSLEQLVKRILEFAQKLVSADRASLFLVDHRNNELVSTVFDLKFEPGQGRDVEKKEIRMPIDRGIAGHVALSGETMNIPDAYSDYRFNRDVDEVTGYTTNSILCMPVKVQGKVIGVVQMVNKINADNFDREDEVAFEIFSTFFGLALHHARLYDKIMRKEQRYRVALEVLSYHNTCKEDEVRRVLESNEDKEEDVTSLTNFYFDPYKLGDIQKCKAVITMFDDLFELSKFDFMTITRFILTVKKNYRAVPYHNFDHGWSVAHAMYVIIKKDHRKCLDYKMRLALFVACLCHDLDHRGYTNKYLNEIASPLAAMYTTSPLEHHHFNITVTILQQDGHNIFSHLSSQEYKDILGYIRNCILATDLAAFFPNLAKLQEIHNMDAKRPHFNWSIPSHRDLGMAISMTAADLSASAKPWDIQIKTVKVIFKEFYEQGDKEREAGKTPIPMMDRNKPEEQPASQVGFLSQICIPCYTILYKILPKTKPMYVMAFKNLNNWKSKVTKKIDDSGKDEDSSEDTLEVISDSELEEDEECEKTDTECDKVEVSSSVHADLDELQKEEDDNNIEDINSKITGGWKCIKSDSVSWEEDQDLKVAETRKIKIWKDVHGNLIDEDGVVTRSNKTLKVEIVRPLLSNVENKI